MIKFRNEHKVFAYGDFKVIDSSRDRFVYERSLGDDIYIIDCNLGKNRHKSYSVEGDYEVVYLSAKDNYKSELGYIYTEELYPYEARIIRINK